MLLPTLSSDPAPLRHPLAKPHRIILGTIIVSLAAPIYLLWNLIHLYLNGLSSLIFCRSKGEITRHMCKPSLWLFGRIGFSRAWSCVRKQSQVNSDFPQCLFVCLFARFCLFRQFLEKMDWLYKTKRSIACSINFCHK